MQPFLIVLAVVAVILILWVVSAFNKLINLKNATKSTWSNIDVQLKRRYDLIPNLLETVKGYAKHEKEVFTKVTEARSNAMNAQSPGEKAKADNMLTGALKSLFAVSENYPELKASENFMQMQNELADTENKIQASRSTYNNQAQQFNTAQEQFPTNIIAKIFAFKIAEFFEIEDEKQKETPQVKF